MYVLVCLYHRHASSPSCTTSPRLSDRCPSSRHRATVPATLDPEATIEWRRPEWAGSCVQRQTRNRQSRLPPKYRMDPDCDPPAKSTERAFANFSKGLHLARRNNSRPERGHEALDRATSSLAPPTTACHNSGGCRNTCGSSPLLLDRSNSAATMRPRLPIAFRPRRLQRDAPACTTLRVAATPASASRATRTSETRIQVHSDATCRSESRSYPIFLFGRPHNIYCAPGALSIDHARGVLNEFAAQSRVADRCPKRGRQRASR